MPANYTITAIRQTSQLQGSQTTVPVKEFSVVTKPSAIFFQFRRTLDLATPANIASVADQLAVRLEEVLAGPNVEDLSYSQDTSRAGQLVDTITVFWRSDDGALTGHFDQPMAAVGPNKTPPLVAADIAHAEALLGA